MKPSALIHFSLLLLSPTAFAQMTSSANRELACERYCILELFPDTEHSSVAVQSAAASSAAVLFDAGMKFISVRDNMLPGISFSMGGANDDFASAFSFEGFFSHRISFPVNQKVISPYYQYLYFGWDNQYFLHPRNKFTLALDLNMGFGFETFADQSRAGAVTYYQADETSSYYDEVSYYSSGNIASGNMFVMELGVNFLYDFSRCISMGAGAHSRIVLGIDKESPLGDTGFYSGNIFLRFRIFGKNA